MLCKHFVRRMKRIAVLLGTVAILGLLVAPGRSLHAQATNLDLWPMALGNTWLFRPEDTGEDLDYDMGTPSCYDAFGTPTTSDDIALTVLPSFGDGRFSRPRILEWFKDNPCAYQNGTQNLYATGTISNNQLDSWYVRGVHSGDLLDASNNFTASSYWTGVADVRNGGQIDCDSDGDTDSDDDCVFLGEQVTNGTFVTSSGSIGNGDFSGRDTYNKGYNTRWMMGPVEVDYRDPSSPYGLSSNRGFLDTEFVGWFVRAQRCVDSNSDYDCADAGENGIVSGYERDVDVNGTTYTFPGHYHAITQTDWDIEPFRIRGVSDYNGTDWNGHQDEATAQAATYHVDVPGYTFIPLTTDYPHTASSTNPDFRFLTHPPAVYSTDDAGSKEIQFFELDHEVYTEKNGTGLPTGGGTGSTLRQEGSVVWEVEYAGNETISGVEAINNGGNFTAWKWVVLEYDGQIDDDRNEDTTSGSYITPGGDNVDFVDCEIWWFDEGVGPVRIQQARMNWSYLDTNGDGTYDRSMSENSNSRDLASWVKTDCFDGSAFDRNDANAAYWQYMGRIDLQAYEVKNISGEWDFDQPNAATRMAEASDGIENDILYFANGEAWLFGQDANLIHQMDDTQTFLQQGTNPNAISGSYPWSNNGPTAVVYGGPVSARFGSEALFFNGSGVWEADWDETNDEFDFKTGGSDYGTVTAMFGSIDTGTITWNDPDSNGDCDGNGTTNLSDRDAILDQVDAVTSWSDVDPDQLLLIRGRCYWYWGESAGAWQSGGDLEDTDWYTDVVSRYNGSGHVTAYQPDAVMFFKDSNGDYVGDLYDDSDTTKPNYIMCDYTCDDTKHDLPDDTQLVVFTDGVVHMKIGQDPTKWEDWQ